MVKGFMAYDQVCEEIVQKKCVMKSSGFKQFILLHLMQYLNTILLQYIHACIKQQIEK